jgi:Arc/MetJ-type ribon-helix-helix transcriptional regulator
METVCIKIEESLAKEMDRVMATCHYVTKTEFIREAIRDKIVLLNEAALARLYGASPKRTTARQLHRAGERAVKDLLRLRGG